MLNRGSSDTDLVMYSVLMHTGIFVLLFTLSGPMTADVVQTTLNPEENQAETDLEDLAGRVSQQSTLDTQTKEQVTERLDQEEKLAEEQITSLTKEQQEAKQKMMEKRDERCDTEEQLRPTVQDNMKQQEITKHHKFVIQEAAKAASDCFNLSYNLARFDRIAAISNHLTSVVVVIKSFRKTGHLTMSSMTLLEKLENLEDKLRASTVGLHGAAKKKFEPALGNSIEALHIIRNEL